MDRVGAGWATAAGCLAWLHAWVPAAEEVDLLEQLARGRIETDFVKYEREQLKRFQLFDPDDADAVDQWVAAGPEAQPSDQPTEAEALFLICRYLNAKLID